MKPLLFSLLFLFISKTCFSQNSENNKLVISPNDMIICLDSLNLETISKDYAYVRIIKDSKLTQESYSVREYYLSGIVKMEGTSKSNNGNPYEGILKNYYKSGTRKSIFNYVDAKKNGKDIEWYENGKKKSEGEFIVDKNKLTSEHKINQLWNENGVQKVVNGNGFFDDKDKNESSKGEIKNGFKEGVWEGSFNKLKWKYKETYLDGKLISGESWDENNVSYKYTKSEVQPEPKNGIKDFLKYFSKSFRTPDTRGLSGKIYVKFVVDEDGKIVESKVLRDIGYGTGEEAIRVLNHCKNWTPGIQRGQKVRCTYSLPISIQSNN